MAEGLAHRDQLDRAIGEDDHLRADQISVVARGHRSDIGAAVHHHQAVAALEEGQVEKTSADEVGAFAVGSGDVRGGRFWIARDKRPDLMVSVIQHRPRIIPHAGVAGDYPSRLAFLVGSIFD